MHRREPLDHNFPLRAFSYPVQLRGASTDISFSARASIPAHTGIHTSGFERIGDIEPEEMNARYFRGRGSKLGVGNLANVMNARV